MDNKCTDVGRVAAIAQAQWICRCLQSCGPEFESLSCLCFFQHDILMYWQSILDFLNGLIPATFCLFSSFSHYNFNITNWKKHRWSAWDLNPGSQDGRRRQNHRAMAANSFLKTCLNISRPPQVRNIFFVAEILLRRLLLLLLLLLKRLSVNL